MNDGNARSLFLARNVLDPLTCRRRRINTLEPLPNPRAALSLDDHELQRFGKEEKHQNSNHEGYAAAKIKDGSPTEVRNQPCGDETTQGCAEVEPVTDMHHCGNTQSRRHVLPR